jgi:hypothetical protein
MWGNADDVHRLQFPIWPSFLIPAAAIYVGLLLFP